MSLFSFSSLPKAEKDFSVAIVVADFNEDLTKAMLEIALKTLRKAKIENVFVQNVPGSFEIPFAVKLLQNSKNFDGILTLGCIIKGETPHFNYVAQNCAWGIMKCNLESSIPVIFGILTCYDNQQAEDRLEKSSDFVKSLIEQMNLVFQLNDKII